MTDTASRNFRIIREGFRGLSKEERQTRKMALRAGPMGAVMFAIIGAAAKAMNEKSAAGKEDSRDDNGHGRDS